MADNLVRTLLRIVSTFAVFGAAYLFLIKPALDTTERTFDRAFDSADGVTKQINESLRGAGVPRSRDGFEIFSPAGKQIDLDQINMRIDTPEKAERVGRCIERAGQDTAKIFRCLR